MLASLSSLLWTIGSFLVAIMILVTIHEFGHFYVARKLGVKVLRFSIGFGKPLFTWRDANQCEYSIAALPLGGYVKMLDEREGDVPAHLLDRCFNRQPVGRRALIVAAGPAANFLLAILIYWLVFLGGERGLAAVVGEVIADSPAAQAGLQVGDEIVAVNGKDVFTRKDVFQQALVRLGDTGTMAVVVNRAGTTRQYELLFELDAWLKGVDEPDPIRGLGIVFYQMPGVMIGSVSEDGAASAAGLQQGDIITAFDGSPLTSIRTWLEHIQASADKAVELTVLRNEQSIHLTVMPRPVLDEASGKTVGRIGAQLGPVPLPETHLRERPHSFLGALLHGVDETSDQTALLLVSLKKLLFGEISAKNISGPVGIAKVAGQSADMGLIIFCQTLALLSISLGVMNILPIPMLDGGHLLLYLAEAIKGSPVSETVQQWGNQIGLFLILSLMVFALYNDLLKL